MKKEKERENREAGQQQTPNQKTHLVGTSITNRPSMTGIQQMQQQKQTQRPGSAMKSTQASMGTQVAPGYQGQNNMMQEQQYCKIWPAQMSTSSSEIERQNLLREIFRRQVMAQQESIQSSTFSTGESWQHEKSINFSNMMNMDQQQQKVLQQQLQQQLQHIARLSNRTSDLENISTTSLNTHETRNNGLQQQQQQQAIQSGTAERVKISENLLHLLRNQQHQINYMQQRQHQRQQRLVMLKFEGSLASSEANLHRLADLAKSTGVAPQQFDDRQSQASVSSAASTTTCFSTANVSSDDHADGFRPNMRRTTSSSSGGSSHFNDVEMNNMRGFYISPAAVAAAAAASINSACPGTQDEQQQQHPQTFPMRDIMSGEADFLQLHRQLNLTQGATNYSGQDPRSLNSMMASLIALSKSGAYSNSLTALPNNMMPSYGAFDLSNSLNSTRGSKRSLSFDQLPLPQQQQLGNSFHKDKILKASTNDMTAPSSMPAVGTQGIKHSGLGIANKSSFADDAESSDGQFKKRRKRRRIKPWSSSYQGVSWHKRDKRWVARIWVEGKTQNLGTFVHEEHAALVVDRRVIRVFGEDGGGMPLNIPDKEERRRLAVQYGLPNPDM